jgi:hypothetical protein
MKCLNLIGFLVNFIEGETPLFLLITFSKIYRSIVNTSIEVN